MLKLLQNTCTVYGAGNSYTIRVQRADSFWHRLSGLLVGPRRPILIPRSRAIHTFGMTYALDVWFVGQDNTILKTISDLNPRRFAICMKARHVIELPHGWAPIPPVGHRVEFGRP